MDDVKYRRDLIYNNDNANDKRIKKKHKFSLESGKKEKKNKERIVSKLYCI